MFQDIQNLNILIPFQTTCHFLLLILSDEMQKETTKCNPDFSFSKIKDGIKLVKNETLFQII